MNKINVKVGYNENNDIYYYRKYTIVKELPKVVELDDILKLSGSKFEAVINLEKHRIDVENSEDTWDYDYYCTTKFDCEQYFCDKKYLVLQDIEEYIRHDYIAICKYTHISINGDIHICGYSGAFLRNITADGIQDIHGIANNWYEGTASDAHGKNYHVYYQIIEGFDINEDDESNACNWNMPYMVIDEDGNNIVDKCKLV